MSVRYRKTLFGILFAAVAGLLGRGAVKNREAAELRNAGPEDN